MKHLRQLLAKPHLQSRYREDCCQNQLLIERCAEAPEEGNWLRPMLALTKPDVMQNQSHQDENDEVQDDIYGAACDEELIDIDAVAWNTKVPERMDRGTDVLQCLWPDIHMWAYLTIGRGKQGQQRSHSRSQPPR